MPLTNNSITLQAGDLVTCPGCGQKHPCRGDDNGSMSLVVLVCPENDHVYVVGVNASPFFSREVEERIYRMEARWLERALRGDTV